MVYTCLLPKSVMLSVPKWCKYRMSRVPSLVPQARKHGNAVSVSRWCPASSRNSLDSAFLSLTNA